MEGSACGGPAAGPGRLDAPDPGVVDAVHVEGQTMAGGIVDDGFFAAVPGAPVVDLDQGVVDELVKQVVEDRHGGGIPVRIHVE